MTPVFAIPANNAARVNLSDDKDEGDGGRYREQMRYLCDFKDRMSFVEEDLKGIIIAPTIAESVLHCSPNDEEESAHQKEPTYSVITWCISHERAMGGIEWRVKLAEKPRK